MRPTLRDLKGAPLACLVALLVIGRPARKEQLADETGYKDKAVEDALRLLSSPALGLVLAIPSGRHPVWALSPAARQSLHTVFFLSREKSDSAGSSSSLINESINQTLFITTTTTELSREKSDSTFQPSQASRRPESGQAGEQTDLAGSPAVALLLKLLTDTGASAAKATAALASAINRGEDPAALAQKIVDGQRYRKSRHGRSIRSPYWLVSCIADGRAIPELVLEPAAEADLSRYDGYLDQGQLPLDGGGANG